MKEFKERKYLAFLEAVKKADKLGYLDKNAGSAPTPEERKILELSATEISAAVSEGRLGATQVLTAFVHQALRSHAELNCLTELNIESATALARAQDTASTSERKQKGGLLQGVPVSLKDQIGLAGTDSSMGITRFAFQPVTEDCPLVEALKKAGALPFVKTNVPQTLISFECENGLFGRTDNPWHKGYTCGGSSGGEAALLANRGAAVGIGTDIGGSLRIPAHFSGVCALKPTARRVSTMGFRSSVPGQEAIPGVCGPMGNSVQDLAQVMKVVVSEELFKRDHELIPIPFNEKEYLNNGKLRVGYYTHDGFLEPSPACTRAVMQTVEALRADGHQVAEFKPPAVFEGVQLYYGLISADNMVTITNQLEEEVWQPYVSAMELQVRMPKLLRALLARVMPTRTAALLRALGRKTVAQAWALQLARKKYRQLWFDAWSAESAKFDVIICPVNPNPAIPHRQYKEVAFTAAATFLFNLLDYPAASVPVTRVKDTDLYTTEAKDSLERKCRSVYDAKVQAGLPIGVQIVGLPFHDETVLRAARVIEKLLPFREQPPTRSLGKIIV